MVVVLICKTCGDAKASFVISSRKALYELSGRLTHGRDHVSMQVHLAYLEATQAFLAVGISMDSGLLQNYLNVFVI